MKKVLIIDDDDLLRGSIESCLSQVGFEVKTAANGQLGSDLAAREPFDLIITDIVMPDKEGLETIMDIKRQNPNQRILAMSGGGYVSPDEYLEIASEFGADRVLSKPFHLAKMVSIVDELTNNQKPDRE